MLRHGQSEAICREVVRLLRAERKRRGLSRYAHSQKSGVSESMLSLVERGLRNPSLEVLLSMADGLEANLPDLLIQAMKTVKGPADA